MLDVDPYLPSILAFKTKIVPYYRNLPPFSEYYQKAVEAAKMFLLKKSLPPHRQNLNQILSIDRLDSYKYRNLVRTIGVEHALLSAP